MHAPLAEMIVVLAALGPPRRMDAIADNSHAKCVVVGTVGKNAEHIAVAHVPLEQHYCPAAEELLRG